MVDAAKLGKAGLASIGKALVDKQEKKGTWTPSELAQLGTAATRFQQLTRTSRRTVGEQTTEDNGIRLEGPAIVPAPDAKAIGEALIKEFAEDLGLLDGAAIGYVFYADALRLRGADAAAIAWIPQIQGEAWKRSLFEVGLSLILGFEPSLLVIIQEQEWAVSEHNEHRRLIFHELLHFRQKENRKTGAPMFNQMTGEPVWEVVPHDVEQFNRVVELFGPDERDMRHLEAAGRWSSGREG